MNMFQFALGRLYGFTQQRKGFQRFIESFPSLLETVLQQHVWARASIAMVEFGRVHRHRALYLLEEVLVIHDVTKRFVVAVEPVRSADSLEQAVVLHRFVDVEVGCAWG